MQAFPTQMQYLARPERPWWPTNIRSWAFSSSAERIHEYSAARNWKWPDRRVCFLCDLHADAEAFLRSLEAAGGILRTGARDCDYSVTPAGFQAIYIIGGDCLDKGPSNLRLLRAIALFRQRGAQVILLAGNHDIRTLVGLLSMGSPHVLHEHLFARMGVKTLQLLREVYDEKVAPVSRSFNFLDDETARRELFPSEQWYESFPQQARGRVVEERLATEPHRIREKVCDIESRCREWGWSLKHLHAAAQATVRTLCEEQGEFAWFFGTMQLAHRTGSFLFIHAGLDDSMAQMLSHQGVAGLNRRFRQLLCSDRFELYHGPIGNCLRTKYRETDFPFSLEGQEVARNAGIFAIVHGHRNTCEGQRILLRGNMLHVECDASVDENTRRLEGLTGKGGGVTIVDPEARMLGVSADADHVKMFAP